MDDTITARQEELTSSDSKNYNDHSYKYRLYNGPIDINNIMGLKRRHFEPSDPMDRLDSIIFPLMLITVIYGLWMVISVL